MLCVGNDEVIWMRDSYKKCRNFMMIFFNEMGLMCYVLGGVFYVFFFIFLIGLFLVEFVE